MQEVAMDDRSAFVDSLTANGIMLTLDEEATVYEIARRCALHAGVPMGAAVGVASAGAGTMTLPGIGTVSAGLVGFLAGAASGTIGCMMLNYSLRDELSSLVREAKGSMD
jgi:hypothetical protein